MKDGEIIESGTPKAIYESPKSKYIASLFGDVNELKIDGKVSFIYPHQLEVVENSDIQVEVLNSYFRGSHYLIEAKLNNEILFFENDSEIPITTKVFLKIK
jgi:ABC-type Fe3+/spermidine/putrescine transport system ATPase subunit